MSILEYYANASYCAMVAWAVGVIVADIALSFSPSRRYEYGYLIISPLYWTVLVFLLPFLNLVLVATVYWLLGKGSPRTKGK